MMARGGTPWASRNVAHPCRRSCSRSQSRPASSAQHVPAAVHVARLIGAPDGGRKHQAVFVPSTVQRAALDVLLLLVLLEIAHRQPRASTTVRSELLVSSSTIWSLPLDTLHGPANLKLPSRQVDVIPSQGGQLAAAQAGARAPGLEALPAVRPQQPAAGSSPRQGKHRSALTGQRRRLDLGGDVPWHQLHPVRVAQGIPDELVHVPQRRGASAVPREVRRSARL